MTFVPGSDWGKVSLCWDFAGVEVCVTLNFKAASAPSEADFLALGGAIDFWVTDSYMPLVSSDLSYEKVIVYDMSAEDAPVYEITTSAPDAGGIAIDCVGRAMAAIGSLRTGGRGRSARGRNYWPGFSESDLTDADWTVGQAAALNAALLEIGTVIDTVDWEWCVASTILNGQPRASVLLQPVTTVITYTTPGTQRRRVRAD